MGCVGMRWCNVWFVCGVWVLWSDGVGRGVVGGVLWWSVGVVFGCGVWVWWLVMVIGGLWCSEGYL